MNQDRAPVTPVAAIVMPVGPGKEAALDTLASVYYYCPEPHMVVIVDDCTRDGTYEALVSHRRPNWQILRNSQPMGYFRVAYSLCWAYRFVLSQTGCHLVLKVDPDALMIKAGVISDALAYMQEHADAGIFGAYACNYDGGPRAFEAHTNLINTEMSWRNWFKGTRPSWAPLLRRAERRGYRSGDNVFAGACFTTRNCLAAMERLGALDVPHDWHSQLMEDVYFSMATVAAGFKMGHFAAPDGPLCLEWQGLPYPAIELAESKYKLIHSVDKGKNTDRDANGGRTPREIFRHIREKEFV